MKKSKKSFILIGFGVMMAVCAGWFILQHQKPSQGDLDKYDTAEARNMDLSAKVDATGSVVLEKSAAVYSPYNAVVKKILVKPGQTVQKGEPLIVLQLNDSDMEINWAAWRSSLNQSQANLTIAQNALDRELTLYRVQGTTIDEVETAQTKVRQYQEEVNEYHLKIASLTQNGVGLAAGNHWEITVRAPFDAMVSWIDVKLDGTVTTTTQLLTLGGDSAIQVEASVDQSDIYQMKEGLQAFITANDENRTTIPAIVTTFGSTGTTSSNVVTFPVVVKPLGMKLPDFKGTAGQKPPMGKAPGGMNPPNNIKPMPGNTANLLKSGMSVDVTIMVNSHPNVLAIPLQAMFQENGKNVVKVLQNGKFVSKEVQFGYKNSDYVEVTSGLTAGTKVAIPKTSTSQTGTTSSKNQSGAMMGPMGGPPAGGGGPGGK